MYANMATSGNLKMPGPSSVSMKVLFIEEKMENLHLRNGQKRAQVHKAAQEGWKRIFQERK